MRLTTGSSIASYYAPPLLQVLLKSSLMCSTVTASIISRIQEQKAFSNDCNKGMKEETKQTKDDSDATTTASVPKPNWSHATNSREQLKKALQDDSITSIEADIVMGHVIPSQTAPLQERIPIMAHPPHCESDLSLSTFLSLATTATTTCNENSSTIRHPHSRVLHKNLKLDIKEFNAIQPTLDELGRQAGGGLTNPLERTIYLNADILPGPGKRSISTNDYISPTKFLQSCIDYYNSQQQDKKSVSFSPERGTFRSSS